MATVSTRELLQREIAVLPEDLAQEVLDFLMFVRERRVEESFLWEQAEAAQAYRQAHPGEAVTVTGEEWETATAPREP
jgi:hypothetical protein